MKQTGKKLVIGVDIGGTHVRTGIVETETSRVLGLTKAKTSELALDILCLVLSNKVTQYEGKIGGIGVVVPDCCSADLRRSISTDGIVPFLDGCDLADTIEKRVGIPARVDNDVRAHIIGELRYGGWGEPRSLLVITLGTGVGLGWYVDGHLYPRPIMAPKADISRCHGPAAIPVIAGRKAVWTGWPAGRPWKRQRRSGCGVSSRPASKAG